MPEFLKSGILFAWGRSLAIDLAQPLKGIIAHECALVTDAALQTFYRLHAKRLI